MGEELQDAIQMYTEDGVLVGSTVSMKFENGSKIEGVDNYNPLNATRGKGFEFTLENVTINCYLLSQMMHGTKNWRTQEISRLNKIWIKTKKQRIKNKLYGRMYRLMTTK